MLVSGVENGEAEFDLTLEWEGVVRKQTNNRTTARTKNPLRGAKRQCGKQTLLKPSQASQLVVRYEGPTRYKRTRVHVPYRHTRPRTGADSEAHVLVRCGGEPEGHMGAGALCNARAHALEVLR